MFGENIEISLSDLAISDSSTTNSTSTGEDINNNPAIESSTYTKLQNYIENDKNKNPLVKNYGISKEEFLKLINFFDNLSLIERIKFRLANPQLHILSFPKIIDQSSHTYTQKGLSSRTVFYYCKEYPNCDVSIHFEFSKDLSTVKVIIIIYTTLTSFIRQYKAI
jgi:threonyl-tRNA synthetase